MGVDGTTPPQQDADDGAGAKPADPHTEAFDRLERLLEFPTRFPLKVMGKRSDEFVPAVAEIIGHHVPDFDPASIERRESSRGTYWSLTTTLDITSRAQLEALHRELLDSPLVRLVL